MNEEKQMPERKDIDLIAHLDECHETCLQGILHSLNEGGDFAKTDHIRWLLNCAEICKLATNFVTLNSEYAGDVLSICAFICDDCAESCETFFDDENMKNCALVCRDCAEVCRESIEEEEEEEESDEAEEQGEKKEEEEIE
jgi:hypothetical protein